MERTIYERADKRITGFFGGGSSTSFLTNSPSRLPTSGSRGSRSSRGGMIGRFSWRVPLRQRNTTEKAWSRLLALYGKALASRIELDTKRRFWVNP
jgi:hypothetical protein